MKMRSNDLVFIYINGIYTLVNIGGCFTPPRFTAINNFLST